MIKIKKLFTACVMNVFDEKGKMINKQVMPEEVVTVSAETLASLDELKEGYKLLDEQEPSEISINLSDEEN